MKNQDKKRSAHVHSSSSIVQQTMPRLLIALSTGLLVCAVMLASQANAYDHGDLPQDLADLSLESLMNIQVTSVSKREESLSAAAAAVYVLSGEDIRRSGARSLPEALRLIPGVTVARIDAHSWSVTARGFSSSLSDKMEVMLDGRSLYTPFFSGVYWDEKNTFIQDIDRIEVIRGPGATLWGANAVNGVINIVTKSAKGTQGTLIEGGAGTGEVEGFAGVRHGGKLGETGHYRAYVQTVRYAENERESGIDAQDGWDQTMIGFRTDWQRDENNSYTVQGDAYDGSIDMSSDTEMEGHNLIARWQHKLSENSDFTLQIFYDHYRRDVPASPYIETRDTYDIDFSHRFMWRPGHEIVWGGGYRRSSDDIESALFSPDRRTLDTYNLFIQDQIDLSEKLKLTIGSKFERNDFTGYEVQPSLRFGYLLDDKRTVWGAVSRAVRTPNRVDHDLFVPPVVVGSSDFESETVIAYELGYRTQLRDNLSLDTTVYYNQYDKLRGVDNSGATPVIANEGEGEGYGIEIAALWAVRENWRIHAGYNYQNLDIKAKPGSTDTSIADNNRSDPHHQLLLRSSWDLRHDLHLDSTLRYVSKLPDQDVDAYTELDIRLAWQYSPRTEFALVGRNLLHDSHTEFASNAGGVRDSVEIQRSLMGTVTWRFD